MSTTWTTISLPPPPLLHSPPPTDRLHWIRPTILDQWTERHNYPGCLCAVFKFREEPLASIYIATHFDSLGTSKRVPGLFLFIISFAVIGTFASSSQLFSHRANQKWPADRGSSRSDDRTRSQSQESVICNAAAAMKEVRQSPDDGSRLSRRQGGTIGEE